jgi:V8-like Glu-specific endopeptidase
MFFFMKLNHFIHILAAVALAAISCAKKDAAGVQPDEQHQQQAKTELEAKMLADGWELLPGAKLIPNDTDEIEPGASVDEGGNVEYFVAIDEQMVFVRRSTPNEDTLFSAPDFGGLPMDFDQEAFQKDMAKLTPTDRTVIGPDNRLPITDMWLLRTHPFRTIGSLTGCEDCLSYCSGVLIGPRHVLTSASCLYSASGWLMPRFFAPGQLGRYDEVTGTPERPNGPSRRGIYYYTRLSNNVSFNYGLVILEDKLVTSTVGWLRLEWFNNLSDYDDIYINLAGFPGYSLLCARSPRTDGRCGGFMFYEGGHKVSQATATTLRYQMDTQPGQSGSPVYRIRDNGRAYVLAVHHGSANPEMNVGTRLRPAVYNDLCNWISNWPSAYASHPCTDN